jgi:hypothetical protein
VARLLLAAASLALVAGVGEIGLRILWPQPMNIFDNTRDRMTVHPPNLDLYLPQFGHRVHMNSAGMRDREHRVEKAPGVFRILLLGDSFIEAVQVPFEDSLPALLRARLEARGAAPVEIVSAGVGGWGTDDELTYLQRYGLRYRPDLVLLAVTLHNDLVDNLAMEYHSFDPQGGLREKPREDFPLPVYLSQKLKAWLSSHCYLYRLIYLTRTASHVASAARALNSEVVQLLLPEPPPRIALGWSMTEALLSKMERVTDAHGARFAVLLIPIEAQLSREEREALLRQEGVSAREIQIDRPQRVLEAWGARAAAPVIDLLPAFRAWYETHPDELYLPEGHWNEQGHEVAADVAADELIARGLVPAPPPQRG